MKKIAKVYFIRGFNQNAVSTGVVGGGGSLPRGVAPARGACSGLVKSQGGRTFPSLPGGLANASSAKVPRPVTSPLSLVKLVELLKESV